VDANILLAEAEVFAQKGLEAFDAEQARQTLRARATHLATIGRIRIKQGRIAEAETALKDAFAANPEIPSAAIGLAELAEKKNDTQGALGYWSTAALTGRLSAEIAGDSKRVPQDAQRFARRPRRYARCPSRRSRTRSPAPFNRARSYQPHGAGRSLHRRRLPALRLGRLGIRRRWSATPQDVAVVMYTCTFRRPTRYESLDRRTREALRDPWRAELAVDGELTIAAAVARPDEGFLRSHHRKTRQGRGSRAGCGSALEASIQGAMVRVKAAPGGLKTEGEPVKLQIALVEQLLSYSGENGVRFHPMVVRSLADAMQGGLTVNRSSPLPTEYYFDLAKISSDIQVYLDDYEVKGRPPNKITFAQAVHDRRHRSRDRGVPAGGKSKKVLRWRTSGRRPDDPSNGERENDRDHLAAMAAVAMSVATTGQPSTPQAPILSDGRCRVRRSLSPDKPSLSSSPRKSTRAGILRTRTDQGGPIATKLSVSPDPPFTLRVKRSTNRSRRSPTIRTSGWTPRSTTARWSSGCR
jgi:hypothetical protein